MKRIRCPKCENYLTFDETKYTEGQSLVFVCENCKKQFSIRLGKTKMKVPQKEERLDETEYKEAFGSITVIENVFGFKQVLPLQEGDNKIGRRCVGTVINVPIETSDMSMDRNHCVINVKRNKQGKLVYTLRDAQSLTGTFLNNEILGDKDRVRIEDGAIVTIGATTFILRAAESQRENSFAYLHRALHYLSDIYVYRKVSLFGTACTSAWYCLYLTMVRRVP